MLITPIVQNKYRCHCNVIQRIHYPFLYQTLTKYLELSIPLTSLEDMELYSGIFNITLQQHSIK